MDRKRRIQLFRISRAIDKIAFSNDRGSNDPIDLFLSFSPTASNIIQPFWKPRRIDKLAAVWRSLRHQDKERKEIQL